MADIGPVRIPNGAPVVRARGVSITADRLPEALLSVKEVARLLALSRATVYKMIDRGEIPHVRFSNAVRVLPDDLRRLQLDR